jgi:two-component system CheB/CheR fusion protein
VSAPAETTFPVVVIGASAGGLEAFRTLLAALPAESAMAFILVQHLDPSHRSMMAELLSPVTKLPVFEARRHAN